MERFLIRHTGIAHCGRSHNAGHTFSTRYGSTDPLGQRKAAHAPQQAAKEFQERLSHEKARA